MILNFEQKADLDRKVHETGVLLRNIRSSFSFKVSLPDLSIVQYEEKLFSNEKNKNGTIRHGFSWHICLVLGCLLLFGMLFVRPLSLFYAVSFSLFAILGSSVLILYYLGVQIYPLNLLIIGLSLGIAFYNL